MRKCSSILLALAALGCSATATQLPTTLIRVGVTTITLVPVPQHLGERCAKPQAIKLIQEIQSYSSAAIFLPSSRRSGIPATRLRRSSLGAYATGNAPVINGSITLSSVSYMTISGLSVVGSASIGELISIEGGSHDSVTGCSLKNAATFGVLATSSPYFVFSNNTYSLDSTFYMYGDVIRVQKSDNSSATGNTATLNQTSNASAGLYFMDSNNIVVANNTLTGGSQQIGIKGITKSVTGEQVHDNVVYYPDDSSGKDGEGIEFTGSTSANTYVSGSIYHNFVHANYNTKNGIGVFMASNVAAYNNIVIGPMQNSAFHWSQNSPGGLFYGNTVYNVPIAFNIITGSSSGRLYNNLVNDAALTALATDSTTSGSLAEDYNIFYDSGAIQAVKRGSHDSTANPQFVIPVPNGPLDVKVESTSPALRSGYSLSSTYKYGLDSASSSFPAASLDQTVNGWNRGAYGVQNKIRFPRFVHSKAKMAALGAAIFIGISYMMTGPRARISADRLNGKARSSEGFLPGHRFGRSQIAYLEIGPPNWLDSFCVQFNHNRALQ